MKNKNIDKSTTSPFVSVIIPNYNHAPFLDERIQSVLDQTYQDFEIIILDDKSTDNSVDIIKKYANNPHVSHILVNEENTGIPFIQWQKGFGYAKGTFIWIAESDDVCEPGLLSSLLEISERNSDCNLLFSKSLKIDEKGLRYGDFYYQRGLDSFVMEGKDFIKKYLNGGNVIINASSAIFKKSALYGVDNIYTTYRGCGDWIFWIEISKNGKVAYLNKYLNYYRVYSNNTTQTLFKMGSGIYETHKVIDYLFMKGYIGRAHYMRRRLSLLMELKYRKGIEKEVQRDVIRKCNYNCLYINTARLLHFLGR